MLQTDILLLVCHVCLRGTHQGTLTFRSLPDTSRARARCALWGKTLWFVFLFVSQPVFKCPFSSPRVEQLGWEDDHLKSLESVSFYDRHSFKKIATNDRTLCLALRQLVLIRECVAHTQEPAVSNPRIIFCLSKYRLSSEDLMEGVLEFKSRGILLPLIDCVY